MGARVSEDNWHRARLISTSGIKSVDEQERRATSALLAVIGAVRELGRAVTQPLGAPTGELHTFVEVPFSTTDTNTAADGLIRVRHGQRDWTVLVEVKTGNGHLDLARLETYLDIAREQRFDAVLTISNEISPAGQHPVGVDRRKLPAVGLYHYTWSHLLAEAVMQKEYRGVADPDQAWVLGELIRYLEHPRSGTLPTTGSDVIDLTGPMEPNATYSSGIYPSATYQSTIFPSTTYPSTTNPSTTYQGTTFSHTLEPRDLELEEMERGTMERATIERGTAERGTVEPGTMEAGTMEPGTIGSMTSVSRSVSVEPAGTPPKLPSRRELRLARLLETGTGTHASVVPEAGWYQDPGDERRLRWYDGTAWSERTYPAQGALT
jgi:Protein of unknown function (DUF2510)